MTKELTEPEQQELFQSILQINNSYLNWEKVQHMTLKPASLSNAEIWEYAASLRNQGAIRKINIEGNSFHWSVSNDMEQVLREIDIHVAGGKGLLDVMVAKNDHRYIINALIDETMASAQLAGFSATKKMVKELLLKKKTTSSPTEQVLANLNKCLQKVKEWEPAEITIEKILELHQLLTKDTIRLKAVGQFRTNNKYDVTAIDLAGGYKGMDFKGIKKWMLWLVQFLNDSKHPFYIHPVIKAGIAEYLINYIRPFRDGNGRLARLIAFWYLLKQGYWGMEYMSASNVVTKLKAQYLKSFVQAQQGNDIGYFIHFKTQAIKMAYRSLKDSLQRTNKEKETNPFVKIEGMNIRQATALQWIKDEPEKIVTIRELRSGFGVSKETARTDLTALIEMGWLKFYHLNKKTYAFVKGDSFDQLMHEKINQQ